MENNQQHHVAWADRLGLNKIWHDAIEECRMTYGTEKYRQSVFGLYHLIVNIKDDPKLKDIVDKYKDGIWEDKIKERLSKWCKENPSLIDEPFIVQSEEELIRDDMMSDLFDYILQLLENEGFGFYKSTEIKHGSDGYIHYNDENNNYED